MGAAFLAVAGAAIIIAIVVEVFQDLFHPAGSGALSDWIGRRVFNLLRRRRPALPLAGPISVVVVIGAWVVCLVTGFAFIYYGSFPDRFLTSTGTVPDHSGRFLSPLYFSFETLITLGYGDLVPQSMAMRFTAAVEGLIGFGLLTASVSSIVLLYPAVSRMRLLARGVAHIVRTERRLGIPLASSGSDVILSELARDVTNTRIDLVHFPVLYYFTSGNQDASVSHWVHQLARLAEEGQAEGLPASVRFAAATLDNALDEFAELLARRFVRMPSTDRDAVFRAVARDHLVSLDG
jgi:hypothetical protein